MQVPEVMKEIDPVPEDENKDIELLFSLGIHEKLRETEKKNQQLEKSLKSLQQQLKKQENLSIRYLEYINSLNQQLKEKEDQLKRMSSPYGERQISISSLCNPLPPSSLTEGKL